MTSTTSPDFPLWEMRKDQGIMINTICERLQGYYRSKFTFAIVSERQRHKRKHREGSHRGNRNTETLTEGHGDSLLEESYRDTQTYTNGSSNPRLHVPLDLEREDQTGRRRHTYQDTHIHSQRDAERGQMLQRETQSNAERNRDTHKPWDTHRDR